LGDDAFGCEAVREMLKLPWPEQVRLIDFGTRVYDLVYALGDGYDAVILVDATPRGQPPGTLTLLELDPSGPPVPDALGVNAHSLTPTTVLQLAKFMHGEIRRLYLVGCEPEVLECVDGRMVLSPAVQAAIPGAIQLVQSLITDLLKQTQPSPSVMAVERS
jgi:hydrogenase maturation protease